ncbi:uncharacterized protein EV422DRAFT_564858 [Fimicolochytrium jonesii]|uniref:uncharacterized protein n=1 Tax=Fimicolochytrium jonesii TaxID=1396493 RepID=UPI0022FF3814|nr:uncharacterized protein EV422DRAFT_564858 [Fimicolochytrium jonesii]KAI8824148.1 hypothetical protein EV422DRAFT_564858 [Fimicolochytrium jonesii]
MSSSPAPPANSGLEMKPVSSVVTGSSAPPGITTTSPQQLSDLAAALLQLSLRLDDIERRLPPPNPSDPTISPAFSSTTPLVTPYLSTPSIHPPPSPTNPNTPKSPRSTALSAYISRFIHSLPHRVAYAARSAALKRAQHFLISTGTNLLMFLWIRKLRKVVLQYSIVLAFKLQRAQEGQKRLWRGVGKKLLEGATRVLQ